MYKELVGGGDFLEVELVWGENGLCLGIYVVV